MVRELVQRSAKAAKEIKELISASNEHVKSGVELVGQTGRALEEIVGQVQQVNVNVTAIVEGSKEQATGLKEINTAVNAMDQGTQQNAAMVEETTAAAHSLSREADGLFELVSQFNIGTAPSVRSASAPSAARPSSRPVTSPARKMNAKLNAAFNGNAAVAGNEWQEF